VELRLLAAHHLDQEDAVIAEAVLGLRIDAQRPSEGVRDVHRPLELVGLRIVAVLVGLIREEKSTLGVRVADELGTIVEVLRGEAADLVLLDLVDVDGGANERPVIYIGDI
jgi:hypothetical protein